jgi:hypothetical protein
VLDARKAELVKQLAEAKQRARHPLSESWGETQSLIGALAQAPDPEDARRRLRSALRRIIDSIYLLVVPRGLDRLAAVQVWFKGGDKHRDLMIIHRGHRGNGRVRSVGRWSYWVHLDYRPNQKGGWGDLRDGNLHSSDIDHTEGYLARVPAGELEQLLRWGKPLP